MQLFSRKLYFVLIAVFFSSLLYAGNVAPTLNIVSVTDRNISLSWVDADEEIAYRLYISVYQYDKDGQISSIIMSFNDIDANVTHYIYHSHEFIEYDFALQAIYSNDDPISNTLHVRTTHTWSDTLLKCLNYSLGNGYVDTHIPDKQEMQSLMQLRCTYKNDVINIEPVRDLLNITLLDLQHDNIESIPPWIDELEDISWLSFANNNLQGAIPDGLWQLPLNYLDLQSNQLSGVISPDINNLFGLQYLHLDHNHFTGEFPRQLNALATNLDSMFLNNNDFNGTIPEAIGSFQALTLLHLEHNRFSGEIPENLRHIPSLLVFIANNNELDGTIPQWLGDKTSLRALYLADNNLSGTIPSSLSKLTNLDDYYGLSLHNNGCLSSDNNTSLEDFIDLKARDFGGYNTIENLSEKCLRNDFFNLAPLYNILLW